MGGWKEVRGTVLCSAPCCPGYVEKASYSILIISPSHGLNNCKDTKPEMSSLLVFNRVYRLDIQSVMLVFSTDFVNYCPSNLG